MLTTIKQTKSPTSEIKVIFRFLVFFFWSRLLFCKKFFIRGVVQKIKVYLVINNKKNVDLHISIEYLFILCTGLLNLYVRISNIHFTRKVVPHIRLFNRQLSSFPHGTDIVLKYDNTIFRHTVLIQSTLFVLEYYWFYAPLMYPT